VGLLESQVSTLNQQGFQSFIFAMLASDPRSLAAEARPEQFLRAAAQRFGQGIASAGTEDRLGPKVTDLARYLRHWNVKVERVRTRGDKTRSEIESAAHDVGADLLVLGAYSRNRSASSCSERKSN
jgi:nucleotide-binding universal stress UspA family protein